MSKLSIALWIIDIVFLTFVGVNGLGMWILQGVNIVTPLLAIAILIGVVAGGLFTVAYILSLQSKK